MKSKSKISKTSCQIVLIKATGKEYCIVCKQQVTPDQSLIKIGDTQYIHSQPGDCSPERNRERFVIDYYTKQELSGMLFGYDNQDNSMRLLNDEQLNLFVRFLMQQNVELRGRVESYLQDQAHDFIYFPYYAGKSWADENIKKCPLCCKEKFGDVEGFHRVTIDARDSDYMFKSTNSKHYNRISVTEVICMTCDRTLGFVADLSDNDNKYTEQVVHNEITGYMHPDIILTPIDAEICYECGRSVAAGSGRFVNRIPSADTYQERKQMGVLYPKGAFMCYECDVKIRDSKQSICKRKKK